MMENNWKVLLIDDDPGIRRILSIALQEAGYNVVTAPDGETGIRLCRIESPQIVITDIGLPGIDGLEVLKRIKEMDEDMEVIVSTAYTEIALAVKAMQLDATGFVTKPVSEEALTQALKRAKERYTKGKDLEHYTSLMEEKWMDTMEELAQTFLFQKTFIESSIDGLIACDRNQNVFIFNESMETMLGCDSASIERNHDGRRLRAVHHLPLLRHGDLHGGAGCHRRLRTRSGRRAGDTAWRESGY